MAELAQGESGITKLIQKTGRQLSPLSFFMPEGYTIHPYNRRHTGGRAKTDPLYLSV